MSTPSIVHKTFVIERTYPHSAARVFAAFSDHRHQAPLVRGGRGLANRRVRRRLPRGRP